MGAVRRWMGLGILALSLLVAPLPLWEAEAQEVVPLGQAIGAGRVEGHAVGMTSLFDKPVVRLTLTNRQPGSIRVRVERGLVLVPEDVALSDLVIRDEKEWTLQVGETKVVERSVYSLDMEEGFSREGAVYEIAETAAGARQCILEQAAAHPDLSGQVALWMDVSGVSLDVVEEDVLGYKLADELRSSVDSILQVCGGGKTPTPNVTLTSGPTEETVTTIDPRPKNPFGWIVAGAALAFLVVGGGGGWWWKRTRRRKKAMDPARKNVMDLPDTAP